MNTFDAAVYLVTMVAIILGFSSGLLRSLATILGYVAAAPVAVETAPAVSLFLSNRFTMPGQDVLVLLGILLITGMGFGALLRRAITDKVGPDIGIADRVAGATVGAIRVGLVVVLIVVIFDRIIPANRQPAFLVGSHLRPLLSAAGQAGLRSLPPDVATHIDRLKQARGI